MSAGVDERDGVVVACVSCTLVVSRCVLLAFVVSWFSGPECRRRVIDHRQGRHQQNPRHPNKPETRQVHCRRVTAVAAVRVRHVGGPWCVRHTVCVTPAVDIAALVCLLLLLLSRDGIAPSASSGALGAVAVDSGCAPVVCLCVLSYTCVACTCPAMKTSLLATCTQGMQDCRGGGGCASRCETLHATAAPLGCSPRWRA